MLSIAACLYSLTMLVGCSKEAEKETDPIVPVQTDEVRSGSIDRIITAEGILRAVDQSSIVPKISAPVRKFYVNRGDHVRKGQLLAELESSDLAANVVDARGAYAQASAAYQMTASATVPDELVKAQQDAQAAKQSAEAAQKLLESREQLYKEGALARRLVDEAAVSYAQSKSQYETAQKHLDSLQSVGRHEEIKGAAGQLESAKGKYEAARSQFSYAQIRSPISGVVADRALFPGETAGAGSPLITIVDASTVIARVNVPPTQAAYLRTGQPATVSATDGSQQLSGKVTVVSPAIDPSSTTVEIWVAAPNPDQRLRPGGAARVTIMADTLTNTIVVPASALLPSTEGGNSVMVIDHDSIAHEHKVQVGVRESGKVQILDGVSLGQRIVVAGGFGLQDGSHVRVEKPAKPGESGDPKTNGGRPGAQ
jgi:multidrug efflux pump subunit AcrA (membrane-fusion protein)